MQSGKSAGFAALAIGLVLSLANTAGAVTIEYWQYDFPARVSAMERLIEAFEAEHSDIDVSMRIFPYEDYRDTLFSAVAAGEGPDVARANFASYWVNALTKNAEGPEREAAIAFLKYLVAPSSMEIWLEMVGELPARRDVALAEEKLSHPLYGAFIRGLDHASTTAFVDEAAQRQILIDMVDRVDEGTHTASESLAIAAAAEKRIRDDAR